MTDTLQNLTPWPKGVSGNPNGRPKGGLNLKTILLKSLDFDIERTNNKSGISATKKNYEWVVSSLINKATAGDVSAIKEIFDRVDGKVAQTSIINGDEEGGALRIEHEVEFKDMTKEQVDAIIRIGNDAAKSSS